MNNSTVRAILQIAVMCVAMLALDATAGTRPPLTGMRTTASGSPLSQSYVWYDGDHEHTVWLNPQVVAEFNPGKAGQKAVAKADANAKELPLRHAQAGIRLWQMNNSGNAAVTGMVTSNPAGKYSPVFHDGPSSSAGMRALPGNVIIQLDPSWSSARANAWLKKRNMQVVKKLNVGSNIFVIKTNPGMEALDAANALYKSGEVKAAYPDWWQEVVTK